MLVAATALIALDGFAQEPDMLGYNKIGLEEGLSSQDYNFYVYVDKEGYCWISSTAGLNRFDGFSVKQYRADAQDSTALFSENIQSRFFEDRQQNLWFCTYDAVHCYERRYDRFRHFFVYDENDKPLQEDYQVFCLEQDSLLWFRAGQQVYRVNVGDSAQTEIRFRAASPVFTSTYYHFFPGLAPDGSVRYLFATTNEKQAGLEYFEIQRGRSVKNGVVFDRKGAKTPELSVFQVFFESPGRIWLTTQKGLVCWSLNDPGSIRLFDVAFTGYSYLVPRDSGHFFVSFSSKGVFSFEKSTGRWSACPLYPIAQHQETTALSPRNLYLDRGGVLWISTPFEGVVYVHPQKRKFRAYPNPVFLQNKKIVFRNLMRGPDGHIWCSYDAGFLVLNANGALIDHVRLNTGPGVVINCAWNDGADGIWVATNDGLRLYNPARRTFEHIPGMGNMDVLNLCRLRDGGPVLASTLFGDIYAIEKKGGVWSSRVVWNDHGIPYTTIFEDERKRIYICRNEAGLDLFTYRGDTLHRTGSLPLRGAINSFLEVPEERALWIGSSFGLVRINPDQLDTTAVVFTVKNGLPDNNVLGIVPGEKDGLWLSTAVGLALFDPRSRAARRYSRADGVLSKRFDKYAYLKLPDGTIWFGGSDGITGVPPRLAPDLATNAAVLLSGLKINDETATGITCVATGATSLNQLQQIELPFTQNTLSFSFTAVDFAFPPGVRLAYKLEEVDKDWVLMAAGEAGFARYPGLPPGRYTFVVRGANSDGRWNEQQRRLSITILTPFWKTLWFRALLLLTGALLAGAAVLYRFNQARKMEQMKRRIAENRMAALIAQLNPHFIFNSLQSINGFILRNNRQQASEYLGRFSRLMRLILEGSRNTTHSIEKERELLELYLKVESQRFKEPFRYEILIDESLDTFEVQLPCMMLQPFVENAIWHGIAHKQGDGFIQVSVQAAGRLLHCSVTDNGIGRKKAAEIALQKEKRHESRALQILSERLSLLFPGQRDQYSVQYTDLVDPEGQPAGTRVEINLPFVR